MFSIDHLLKAWLVFFSLAFIIWYLFKDLTNLTGKQMWMIVGEFMVYNIIAMFIHYYFLDDRIDFIVVVIWVFLIISLIKKKCQIRLGELIFIFFIIVNYSDAIYLFYRSYDRILPVVIKSHLLLPISLVIYILVNIICLPPMILIVKRVVKPIIMKSKELPLSNYLWLVPVCFFLIYRFCLLPAIEYMKLSELFITNITVPIFWYVAVTLAHTGLFITLERTIEGKEIEEKYHALDRQNQLQQDQYRMIETQFNDMRRMRHDIRHHVLAVREYLSMEEYEKADHYLDSMLNKIHNESICLCDNIVVEAMVQHFLKEAQKDNIKMTTSLKLPRQIAINEQDLITLLGNLLENAFEACRRQKQSPRFVDIKAGISGTDSFMIVVSNSFEGKIVEKEDGIISSKREHQIGIGIPSIKKIVNKYNGITNITYDDHVFKVQLLLNH